MIIIEAEGLDKSGKRTQTDLLVQYLKEKGYNVVKSEFHRYDTPTGQLIRSYLKEEWDTDDLTIELIIAADKQAQQSWFNSLENQGVEFLILDRYKTSQVCFSRAKGVEEDWIRALQRNLREPDISILFDITPVESMRRKGQHGKNDRYESNLELLTTVREDYLNYFNNLERGLVLHDISNLTVSEVHALLITKLSKVLDI